ncbi:MAG: LapA family protein [Coleofasciculaceae cyanobacterium]
MKIFANLLTSLIVALWIGAIAILSIQNITPVSLKFLMFESIQLPVSLVLTGSVGIGLVFGAIAPLLWQGVGERQETLYPEEELDYLDEEPIQD